MEMRSAVCVSLGSPTRDKAVELNLNGVPIRLERRGAGGDAKRARRMFAALDGEVDALAVGGTDLYINLDGRDYPIRATHKLVRDVHRTPVVDGRRLEYALERRLFELAAPLLGDEPHFRRAFIPFAADRLGLVIAVSEVADEVRIGDLMFMVRLPIAVHGLKPFKRLLRIGLPFVGHLPMAMLYPPGSKDQPPKPRFARHWREADLIAGDWHYIHQYAPSDLERKVVITNTTTEENIELLRRRGVHKVLTTTPRYEGRSFGVSPMEGLLTAYAGQGRPLTIPELDALIDELDLRPTLQVLNP